MFRRTLVVAGVAASIWSCGGSKAPAQPTFTPVPAATNTILIPNTGPYGTGTSSFSPASITVPVGTTVTWGNNDLNDHTTTSNSSLWNAALDGGQTYQYRFTAAGTYEYHCTNHATMRGTVIVQ
jgi:plastocyanin